MTAYRVVTVTLVEASSAAEALELEGMTGGEIEEWYAELVEDGPGDVPTLAGQLTIPGVGA